MKIKNFYTWLSDQTNRDNLIGDISKDICSGKLIDKSTSYEKMQEIVSQKTIDFYGIESLDDWDKKGKIHPCVCLEIAFREYKPYVERKQLSKYILPSFDGYVYFLRDPELPDEIKIGRARDVSKRISSFNTGRPRNLELIRKIYSGDYKEYERKVHKHFEDSRIRREWFRISHKELENFFDNINDFIE